MVPHGALDHRYMQWMIGAINWKGHDMKKIDSLESLHQLATGYRHARVIQTAAKLRIFDHTNEPATAEEIAGKAGIQQRGADILLDALTALGLLIKTDNRYVNTVLASEHLVSSASSMLLNSLDHSEQIYRRWAGLPEVVRTGTRPFADSNRFDQDQNANRIFIRAMHAHGFRRGRQIAESLDLSRVRNVADIGGGAGSYLIALSEKIPDMQGVLIDQKLTLNTASEIIGQFDLSGKIQLLEMDIFENTETPFTSDMDLIILSNILHIEGPDANIRLLRRIHQSLKPTGQLVIQDFFLDETGTMPLDGALFAVNMLVSTDRGRAWRAVDVEQWVRTAGFSDIQSLNILPDAHVWVVTKAGHPDPPLQ